MSATVLTMKRTAAQKGADVEAYPGDETSLLGMLIRYFEESERASFDARAMAEKCRDYFDGRQWSAAEMAVLRTRRQPPSTTNYVRQKVEMLAGLERKGRSDPKAFPRNPTEDNRADAATQVLRYIVDDQRYDVTRSSVHENILIEGAGACEVIVEKNKTGDIDIVINHITWDRLFWDPHSYHPGFYDARYKGIVIWMDRDEALEKYPGCDDILDSTFDHSQLQTYADKPNYIWADSHRRRVRVAQIHWKVKNDWWLATITRGGFLEGPNKSPYIDRHENATSSLIMRSCYCDRDLQRYGIVKDLISIQDGINKRESKLLHALTVNQIVAEQGAVEDVDRTRNEAAKPDGVIIHNKGFAFEIRKDEGEIEGHFKLLQHSIQQMNVFGPNASMSGKDPREQSGRAIIAQQAGGQVEYEPIADTLRQHTHKVYEACWMRVKQFWTAQKWIRVTDSDKNVKFVGLNNPVTIQDLLDKIDHTVPLPLQLKGMPPRDVQAIMMGLRLPPGDPRLGTVVRVENDVNDMDVDITVEEGPDNPTMQAEQFQTIMQLPPQILMQFPPEFIIQASSLRNKDQLVKMLQDHQQQQAAGQQKQQALQESLIQGKVDNLQATAADKKAQSLERIHGIAKDHANQPLDQMEQLHGMAMDHAAASQPPDPGPPDNSLMPPAAPPPPDPAAQQAQQHNEMMDQADMALRAQQQAHVQRMDIAKHGLAVKQAMRPQPGATP